MRKGSIQKWVDLDKDDARWLESTYPGISYSALLTMLLKKFREVHISTPSDYAEAGAQELKRMLEEPS